MDPKNTNQPEQPSAPSPVNPPVPPDTQPQPVPPTTQPMEPGGQVMPTQSAGQPVPQQVQGQSFESAPGLQQPVGSGKKSKLPLVIIGVVLAVLLGGGILFALLGGSSPSPEEIAGRDVKRRLDLANLSTVIFQYQANNTGKNPSLGQVSDEVIPEYILADSDTTGFNDPLTEEPYKIVSGTPEVGEIQYAEGMECGDDNELSSAKARRIALRIQLEAGEFSCTTL